MRVLINGDKWDIEVVSVKQMKKEREDGDYGGLCIPADRTIFIAEDSIDLRIVTHELYHAYWSYLYLDDTQTMSVIDVEEIAAGMFTDKATMILKQAKSIHKSLSKGKR